MSTWEIIAVSLGGNALLLAALGVLARSLLGQVLTKDLERFKADLLAASAASTERLKHELHIAAQERHVLISKLHERRATVIAELYGMLVEAHWAAQDFASPIEWSGEPTKREKFVTATNKSVDFFRYFDKNRIYLPSELCAKLEAFNREMRAKVVGFGVYVRLEEPGMPDESSRRKMDAWSAASDYFDKEAPKTRAALEAELRKIIGAGEESAS